MIAPVSPLETNAPEATAIGGVASAPSDEDRAAAMAMVQGLPRGWDLASHQRREDRRQLLEEQSAALLGGSIAEGLTA